MQVALQRPDVSCILPAARRCSGTVAHVAPSWSKGVSRLLTGLDTLTPASRRSSSCIGGNIVT